MHNHSGEVLRPEMIGEHDGWNQNEEFEYEDMPHDVEGYEVYKNAPGPPAGLCSGGFVLTPASASNPLDSFTMTDVSKDQARLLQKHMQEFTKLRQQEGGTNDGQRRKSALRHLLVQMAKAVTGGSRAAGFDTRKKKHTLALIRVSPADDAEQCSNEENYAICKSLLTSECLGVDSKSCTVGCKVIWRKLPRKPSPTTLPDRYFLWRITETKLGESLYVISNRGFNATGKDVLGISCSRHRQEQTPELCLARTYGKNEWPGGESYEFGIVQREFEHEKPIVGLGSQDKRYEASSVRE